MHEKNANRKRNEKQLIHKKISPQFLPIEIGGLLRHFYEQSRRKQQQEDGKHKAVTMVDKQLDL